LLLTIQDDGAGFDASRIKGLGLLGMAERVTHLGGDFRIESEPGRGVLVRAELPLPANP
jgi:signal transduction histidine kinase